MFKNRLFTVVLALVVVAMFAGCAAPAAAPAAPAAPAAQPTAAPAAAAAQPTAAPAAAAAKPAEGKFKVGLLSPGSVNDQGWNSIAYGALKRIESELGAEISYVELKQDPASYEKAFRDFASQGYQMILGHGNEFQDAAIAVAKDYPKTQFFISSSRVHEPTVTGLNTASDQTFYLMGVTAAKLCKAAGLVGGMEIPPVSEAFIGFVNGARSVKPDFKYFQTYIGNFDDAAAAKEAALGMIAQGADCIVPDADVAGQGAYQAVVEKGPNIWTFGAFTPATKSAPGQVLANYTSDYGQGIVAMAKEVKDGTFKGGKNVEFGVGQPDVMKFEWDSTSKLPIPQDVKDAVEAAKKDLAAGKINALAPLK
jgi:basic membrane protein A and related proteins